jgi:hypothetical protein
MAVMPCFAQQIPDSALAQKEDAPQVAAPAPSEEPESNSVTYGFEADFNSRYLWRGISFSRGAVFQPSVWVNSGPYKALIWANMNMADEANQGEFNEVDYVIGYTHEIKYVTIEPTLSLYSYPNTGVESSAEATVKVSKPVGNHLTVYTAQNLMFKDPAEAYFGEIGVTHEREFGKWAQSAGVSLGYGSSKFNRYYLGVKRGGLNSLGAQVSWTYTSEKGYYVRPHFNASYTPDRRLREAAGKSSYFVAGLAVGKEF